MRNHITYNTTVTEDIQILKKAYKLTKNEIKCFGYGCNKSSFYLTEIKKNLSQKIIIKLLNRNPELMEYFI